VRHIVSFISNNLCWFSAENGQSKQN